MGHVPHNGRQPPSLGNVVHVDVLKEPSKLDELCQLLAVVLGVEPPGLRLCQRRLTQV
jgi:hypothetical protein